MLKRWNFLKTGFYEGINIGPKLIDDLFRTQRLATMGTAFDDIRISNNTVVKLAAKWTKQMVELGSSKRREKANRLDGEACEYLRIANSQLNNKDDARALVLITQTVPLYDALMKEKFVRPRESETHLSPVRGMYYLLARIITSAEDDPTTVEPGRLDTYVEMLEQFQRRTKESHEHPEDTQRDLNLEYQAAILEAERRWRVFGNVDLFQRSEIWVLERMQPSKQYSDKIYALTGLDTKVLQLLKQRPDLTAELNRFKESEIVSLQGLARRLREMP